jgi:hypothetical protein
MSSVLVGSERVKPDDPLAYRVSPECDVLVQEGVEGLAVAALEAWVFCIRVALLGGNEPSVWTLYRRQPSGEASMIRMGVTPDMPSDWSVPDASSWIVVLAEGHVTWRSSLPMSVRMYAVESPRARRLREEPFPCRATLASGEPCAVRAVAGTGGYCAVHAR